MRVAPEGAKALAYRGLELLHRGRGVPRTINNERIRLPARYSRYYPRQYEPDKSRFIRSCLRPGMVALDLGAHLGIFTVQMARMVGPDGHVYSFEPAQDTAAALRDTIRLNGVSGQVSIREAAVADAVGHRAFMDSGQPVCNANMLVPSGSTRMVDVTTIDTVCGGADLRLGFIKMDIEGAELAALKGGQETIRRDRPSLAIEVHPRQLRLGGDDPHGVYEFLHDAGYELFQGNALVDPGLFSADDCFEVQARVTR